MEDFFVAKHVNSQACVSSDSGKPVSRTDIHIRDMAYDRYSLRINGKREFIRSGAMHYFRLPSQALWRDRLYKLKVAGYNTVDLYFNWGFHSQAEGEYDFKGIRDVDALLKLTQELGLWVIARPGPYINAEVSGGGFPMWLLAKKDVPLRNRRNGAFEWSDEYMGYVRQWWEQIIPIVNRFDNVLMVQIENEYSTLEVEPDYMQALYQMTRDLGVKVPLSHNDLFIAGLYEDIVDLYAFDNYSVTQFETDWRKMNGLFSVLDNIENNIRPFCQNRPLIAAELQAGWFGMWKGLSYEDITVSLGREHINVSTKTVLAQGLTVFNHYKAIGGTNWNHIGSTETYTSYDFGAPISEVGLNTIRLYEAKALNYLLDSFDMAATDRVDPAQYPFQCDNADVLYCVRKNVDSPGHWIFLRNLGEKSARAHLRFSEQLALSLKVQPHDMLLLPCGIQLSCGVELLYTNAEPIYQRAAYVVFNGSQGLTLGLKHSGQLNVSDCKNTVGATLSAQTLDGDILEISSPALDEQDIAQICLNNGDCRLVIIALGQELADRFWRSPDLLGNAVLIGPDAILQDKTFAVSSPRQPVYHLESSGNLREISLPKVAPKLKLPALTEWRILDAAPEIKLQAQFKPISPAGLDLDANRHFEGSAWYCVDLGSSRPAELQIDATHLWAVYLNGHAVAQGHYLNLIHEETENPLHTVTLPAEHFQDADNRLVIFVDSLGHPKGFHDDEQEAQGLLRLFIDGQDIRETAFAVRFSGGLAHEKQDTLPDVDEKSAYSLLYAEIDFVMPDIEHWECPLGFSLSGLHCERVNLYVNGTLLGRYWEACKAQETFYLSPGLLNMAEGATNRISLVCMNFKKPVSPAALKKTLQNANAVSLAAYDVLQKYPNRIEVPPIAIPRTQ